MNHKYLLFTVLLTAFIILTACGSSDQSVRKVESVSKAVSQVTAVENTSYPDAQDIGTAYQEAVARMTGDHILQGYDDGKFYPAVILTREQGAKIITYLLLSPEQAEKLICTAAPYNDVAADRWSAACIAWCTEHHILDGYGDGNYGPADQLTGQQFAKMLLCGYQLGASEYIGDSWADKVGEDGMAAGLFAGDEAMNSSNPLQRQQAALMADNARKAVGSSSSVDSGSSSAGGNTSSGESSGGSAGSNASSGSSSGSSSGNGSSSDGSISHGGSGGSSDSNGGSIGEVETPEIGIDLGNGAESGTESVTESVTESTINNDSDQNNDVDQSGMDEDSVIDSNGDVLLPEAP